MEGVVCYICGSSNHVDNHHIDYRRGKVSPEIVPLCRRCHRTLHDLGVEWFDDEFLDKAVKIDNKRREIWNLAPLSRDDIKRSEYYCKMHGIKVEKIPKPSAYTSSTFIFPKGEPLPGWDWILSHLGDEYAEPIMELYYDDQLIGTVTGKSKRGSVREIVKGLRENNGE
jgi:uncharacterized protein YlaI